MKKKIADKKAGIISRWDRLQAECSQLLVLNEFFLWFFSHNSTNPDSTLLLPLSKIFVYSASLLCKGLSMLPTYFNPTPETSHVKRYQTIYSTSMSAWNWKIDSENSGSVITKTSDSLFSEHFHNKHNTSIIVFEFQEIIKNAMKLSLCL